MIRLAAASPRAQQPLDAQRASYPLTACVVSGQGFEPDVPPVEHVHDGTLVRLCCSQCSKEFEKDPDAFVAKVRAFVVRKQAPDYPLDTCVVSGEPLVEPVQDVLHGTRLLRFCCKGCVKEYRAAPEYVVALLDAELAEREAADGEG